MSEEIKSIKKWFELAKPNPTIEDACVQIGCHYEEVAEMAAPLGDTDAQELVEDLAFWYKKKNKNYSSNLAALSKADKVELLDALCDQIVTSVGVAHMLRMDIEGALNEVNDSNYSKFEDNAPLFDKNGKIRKGKDYFAPDLARFVK